MSAKKDGSGRRLDERECVQLLAGLLAGILVMTDVDTLRRAVAFWTKNDEAWLMVCSVAGVPPSRPPSRGSGGMSN